jgi:hypothetical protein
MNSVAIVTSFPLSPGPDSDNLFIINLLAQMTVTVFTDQLQCASRRQCSIHADFLAIHSAVSAQRSNTLSQKGQKTPNLETRNYNVFSGLLAIVNNFNKLGELSCRHQ